MIIRIKNTQRKQRPQTARIKKKLTALLTVLDLSDAELSVVFTGDRAMRTLNRTYRGKDRTTDVLSFPLQEKTVVPLQPRLLGDIVISLPAAARQAARYGERCSREIDRLLVHGLLHLLGYDHERGRRAAAMRRKEASLLKQLTR